MNITGAENLIDTGTFDILEHLFTWIKQYKYKLCALENIRKLMNI